MGLDLICVSNILLPCAATQPGHAVRKAELDALAERVTALESITYVAPPIINGYTYNKGALSVDFNANPNVTRYKLVATVYPSGTIINIDDYYESNKVIVLNREGYENDGCVVALIAFRGNLESDPVYMESFLL